MGGGGPCRLAGVADRPFLFCFKVVYVRLADGGLQGFACPIPFYAACI